MNDELEGEELRRLLDATADLPREVAPPAGAWTEIRNRIEAQRVQSIAPAAITTPVRGLTRWWPAAAAAAVLFVAGSAIMARRAKSRELQNIAVEQQPVPLSALPARPDTPMTHVPVQPLAVPASLATSNPALAAALEQYQQASRELEASVAAQTASLPPATREVVRRSIATIDAAIADLREALGTDPRNASLGKYLSAAYEEKLDFLKRVRTIPGAGM